MVDGLFYYGSKNRTIGAFYLLECRVHLGIATPSRQGRERTELNYHATTNCSRLSIPGLVIRPDQKTPNPLRCPPQPLESEQTHFASVAATRRRPHPLPHRACHYPPTDL